MRKLLKSYEHPARPRIERRRNTIATFRSLMRPATMDGTVSSFLGLNSAKNAFIIPKFKLENFSQHGDSVNSENSYQSMRFVLPARLMARKT